MNRYEVKDHEPSYLPEGEWKLVWADEFDGTKLDETKWSYRLDFWGKRSPTFSEDAIVDGKGFLHLPLVKAELPDEFIIDYVRVFDKVVNNE